MSNPFKSDKQWGKGWHQIEPVTFTPRPLTTTAIAHTPVVKNKATTAEGKQSWLGTTIKKYWIPITIILATLVAVVIVAVIIMIVRKSGKDKKKTTFTEVETDKETPNKDWKESQTAFKSEQNLETASPVIEIPTVRTRKLPVESQPIAQVEESEEEEPQESHLEDELSDVVEVARKMGLTDKKPTTKELMESYEKTTVHSLDPQHSSLEKRRPRNETPSYEGSRHTKVDSRVESLNGSPDKHTEEEKTAATAAYLKTLLDSMSSLSKDAKSEIGVIEKLDLSEQIENEDKIQHESLSEVANKLNITQ